MRKWKHGFQLMKRQLNNEDGITLVELIAVLALFTIIIALGGSIFWFGSNQYAAQTEAASQNNDLSYAMTVLSKDLRSEASGDVTVESDAIIIKDGPTYEVKNSSLMQDELVLVEGISKMNAGKTADNRGLEITLTSTTDNSKTFKTVIYFRGDGDSD